MIYPHCMFKLCAATAQPSSVNAFFFAETTKWQNINWFRLFKAYSVLYIFCFVFNETHKAAYLELNLKP